MTDRSRSHWLGPAVVVASTALLVGLIAAVVTIEVRVTSPLWWLVSALPLVPGIGLVVGSLVTQYGRATRRVVVGIQVIVLAAVIGGVGIVLTVRDTDNMLFAYYCLAVALLVLVAVVSSLASMLVCLQASRRARRPTGT